MSAVKVEYAENFENAPPPGDGAGPEGGEGAGAEEPASSGRRRRREPLEIEVEREVTKRQIIQSISTIVVVILYMVFTLLRDRDAGVVVVDPDDAGDDWDEA